jgi:predicted transcriptional regulator
MMLYTIWVLAVNGAIPPQTLASQSGTALIPLAAEVGPGVRVLGSIFVILGMGMASIHFTLGLSNLVRERLPTLHPPVVTLPRRRGQLILHGHGRPADDPRMGLTYLGLEGNRPRLRLDLQMNDRTNSVDIVVSDRWDAAELPARLPDLASDPRLSRVRLTLNVLDASQESVRLRITSPLALTYEGAWDTAGLRMTDLLTLPDAMRQIVTWMMRQGPVSPAEVAAHIGQDEETAHTTLEALVEQGFVGRTEVEGKTRYRAQLAHRRGRELPQEIWQALDVTAETQAGDDLPRPSDGPTIAHRFSRLAFGERGRSLLSASPVVVIFLLTEWLFYSGAESFARPISILGVIVISLLGGIFPVLLLASSRRKGECVPGVAYRFLGHPAVLGIIYALSLSSLLLHGLVIWEDPVERAVALVVGVAVVGMTVAMARRGAFATRAIVELREDRSERQEEQAVFAITASGQPATAEVRLEYSEGERDYQTATDEVPTFSSLRRAIFQLPAREPGGQPKLADELKVWAHRVTPEGEHESLPASVEVRCGQETARFDLKLSGGQAVLPLVDGPCRVAITLEQTDNTV